ncbi:hypothetical protein D3C81_1552090 [compost metagenome]
MFVVGQAVEQRIVGGQQAQPMLAGEPAPMLGQLLGAVELRAQQAFIGEPVPRRTPAPGVTGQAFKEGERVEPRVVHGRGLP